MSPGIVGLGVYVPPTVVTADDLSTETGIPADVLREKFGVRQVHRAGPTCHVSEMAHSAACAALEDADLAPEDLDLVVYCGSEYKDYIVWSAATKLTHDLGASRAQAFEVYALCAGAPIALRIVKNMMAGEEEINTALVVAASKESTLVDRRNERTRFMFNFGDGAGAAVVRRDAGRNLILGSASVVEGSLSEDAVMPAGGSRRPQGPHLFDVPDPDTMRDKLDQFSADNFLTVIHDALRRSRKERIDFLALVHMKRSIYDWLRVELHADRSFYLEDYGHMQAADQFAILYEARHRGLLHPGDTVVLAAAGVGYTWSATVLEWGPQ